MTECTLDSSAVDWIIDHPEAQAVLEGLGIDCSCAGRSLEFACRRQGLEPQAVLARLLQLIESRPPRSDPMALTHAKPGEVIHLGPSDSTSPPTAGGTRALFKTSRVEIIRLELPQGKTIKEHRAPGELIVQCLQGRVTFTTMNREITIEPGQLFYLSESEPHAVHAHDDSRLLLTILSPGKVQDRAGIDADD